MNDHHFSYPVVVPLRGATISGHARQPLVDLTYELLDAHADTTRIAMNDATEAEWRNHLAYLRDLQRVGREALAREGVARG